MWVVRAGQKSIYFNDYIEKRRIFIPWDGYKCDLSKLDNLGDYRKLVLKEKGSDNSPVSISNWTIQLFSFVREMRSDDYVLIPSELSRYYCLARIKGGYCYDGKAANGLYHSREIEILETNIPRGIFEQSIQYSLGAYRTIFHAKYEDEILETIDEWRKTR